MMGTTYLFLDGTQAWDQRPRKEQRLANAHVQQNHFEKKRAQPHGATAERNSSESRGGTRLRFRLNPTKQKSVIKNDRKQQCELPGTEANRDVPQEDLEVQQSVNILMPSTTHWFAPLGSPSSRGVDPFGVLPFQHTVGDRSLLQRFQRHERWPWCPINGQSEWATFTVSDELVFRVTMYTWSTHMLGKHPPEDPLQRAMRESEQIRYKSDTISIIKTRLLNPEAANSDEVIAAVAVLTNAEIAVGSMEDAAVHMNGLHALIRHRGGLGTLSSPRQQLIQRLSAWNVFLYAEFFRKPINFPPLDLWEQSWHLLPIRNGEEQGEYAAHSELSEWHLLVANIPDSAILSMLHDIQLLCGMEAKQTMFSLSNDLAMRRGDAFHRIEWRLKTTIDAVSQDLDDQLNRVINVIALACLLYVHHCLRGNPLTYRNFPVLVEGLMQGLQAMADNSETLEFAPLMQLWVVAVGAMTSNRLGAFHDFFLTQLSELCITRGLTQPDFIGSLQGFLWCGVKDEERFLSVWDEMFALDLMWQPLP